MKVKGTPEHISQDNLRQHYDERFAQRPLRARERFYAWIANRVGPPEGSCVLDIGCGGGYLLKELHGKGCQLHGCDISTEALRIAKTVVPEAKFALADAQKLPYPDASFDIVYNLGSLEHFLDMEAAVREMHRVLHSRGCTIVMVPNSRYFGDLWRRLTFRGGADHHQLLERYGTLKEWKTLLESGGLKVQHVFAHNKFKKRLRLLPLHLAYCFIFTCTTSK